MKPTPTLLQQLGKRHKKGENTDTGSSVRMVLKSKSRVGVLRGDMMWRKLGCLGGVCWWGSSRAGGSMVCVDVHYGNLGLHSELENEQFLSY